MRIDRLLAVGCAAAAPALAWGQQTTCTSANLAVSLGTYVAYQATDLDSSATMVVSCTRQGGPGNVTVTIGLGPSATSASIPARRLRGTSDLLGYNFYRDAGRSLIWGETIGANTVAQTRHIKNNTTERFEFPIYGRIHALQDVAPGAFRDTLTMTVTF